LSGGTLPAWANPMKKKIGANGFHMEDSNGKQLFFSQLPTP